MIIETSSLDSLARARRFYTREGYTVCGQIPHFYAKNEAKITFVKQFESISL